MEEIRTVFPTPFLPWMEMILFVDWEKSISMLGLEDPTINPATFSNLMYVTLI